MRTIYILFTTTILLMVIFIALAFLFFEKEKHQTFFYTIEESGVITGYIKADYYKTEDKIIYKSLSFRPYALKNKITNEKLTFSREKFMLERFTKNNKDFGKVIEANYIRNSSETFDFLAKYGSKFSTVSKIPHAKDISVFARKSIVTYMPFVDKYNFSRGGAQSFNALYHFLNLLPPARGKIIFTSIRDEYINIGKKKIKTEVLVVKAKGIRESYIWVSKKDKSIVQLEIKDTPLLVKKVTLPPVISGEEHKLEGESYKSQEVLFPSGDIALAGTIDLPNKEGRLSSVLLVAGEEPYDRNNTGIYKEISHELAKNGNVVLRFDKRGIGKSQGDNLFLDITNEIKDIESALSFLSSHKKVDKDKIFIIAHSDACSYIPRLNFTKWPVRGLIMLSIARPSVFLDFESEHVRDKMNALTVIDKKYNETLDSMKEETLNLIKNTKKDFSFQQGNRVFTNRMKELLEIEPLEGFKGLNVPSLIIEGKKDKIGSPAYVENIEKILGTAESGEFSFVYFRGLGHFLGELVKEPGIIEYNKIDKEVLETIKDWISAKSVDLSRTPPSTLDKVETLTNM